MFKLFMLCMPVPKLLFSINSHAKGIRNTCIPHILLLLQIIPIKKNAIKCCEYVCECFSVRRCAYLSNLRGNVNNKRSNKNWHRMRKEKVDERKQQKKKCWAWICVPFLQWSAWESIGGSFFFNLALSRRRRRRRFFLSCIDEFLNTCLLCVRMPFVACICTVVCLDDVFIFICLHSR